MPPIDQLEVFLKYGFLGFAVILIIFGGAVLIKLIGLEHAEPENLKTKMKATIAFLACSVIFLAGGLYHTVFNPRRAVDVVFQKLPGSTEREQFRLIVLKMKQGDVEFDERKALKITNDEQITIYLDPLDNFIDKLEAELLTYRLVSEEVVERPDALSGREGGV